jgi:hypothetical protein
MEWRSAAAGKKGKQFLCLHEVLNRSKDGGSPLALARASARYWMLDADCWMLDAKCCPLDVG